MKTRFLTAIIALVSVFGIAQERPQAPPPMNEKQIARVRELVKTNQEEVSDLKARLNERQQRLARVYARYQLDEKACKTIQDEIIELQRRLLASHHQMQVELRGIVGKERFDHLRLRLEQGQALSKPAVNQPERQQN